MRSTAERVSFVCPAAFFIARGPWISFALANATALGLSPDQTAALLALRHRLIVPRLAGMRSGGDFRIEGGGVLRVDWLLGDGSRLHLVANFAATPSGPVPMPPGQIVYANPPQSADRARQRELSAWFVAFTLEESTA